MPQEPLDANPPTMIIPRGTEIQVDAHGQLSVRAPGNLVIQNSGSYGSLESVRGSIRIEPEVEVEAVTVRCAEACYVQGHLTAWRVKAKSLHLEDSARAHIVLQETERLEIGKEARLVGNFGSEKELFLVFSRFARQIRSLPFYFDRRAESLGELVEEPPKGPFADEETEAEAPRGELPGFDAPNLPEPLFFAQVLLERNLNREGYGPAARRVLEEVIKLLREKDLETLRHTYRALFRRVPEPGEDIRRAHDLIQQFFAEG